MCQKPKKRIVRGYFKNLPRTRLFFLNINGRCVRTLQCARGQARENWRRIHLLPARFPSGRGPTQESVVLEATTWLSAADERHTVRFASAILLADKPQEGQPRQACDKNMRASDKLYMDKETTCFLRSKRIRSKLKTFCLQMRAMMTSELLTAHNSLCRQEMVIRRTWTLDGGRVWVQRAQTPSDPVRGLLSP